MIRRLYIHNYRCFENLDLHWGRRSSLLVLGKNGTGKSSLVSALHILQQIARGSNRIRDFLTREDFAQHRTGLPVRIELSLDIGDNRFEYCIAFELPPEFREARVKEEQLKCDGEVVYSREQAQVELVAASTSFLVDWHFVALPIVQMREGNNPIEKFRSWLARIVLISPVPSLMASDSKDETLYPDTQVSNLADWFTGVLGAYPAAYSLIDNYLKQVMPDFFDFQNKSIGESAKRILVRFRRENQTLALDLNRLSDGEKSFLIGAMLLAANHEYGPLFCLWDEPDNFLSLSEVGHLIVVLRKSFKQAGQIVMTSHNPETIRKFSDENTLYLDRKSHLEPTIARWLSEIGYQGDLVDALIRGDVAGGSE